MPKIAYLTRRLSPKTRKIVEQANEIIAEYEAAGFTLTLRQLYYQFVARDLLANSQKSYKKLGNVMNDARLAGLIDWHALEDRTRSLRRRSHFDGPGDVMRCAASSYGLDLWEGQDRRVEVWIEKDALIGVIERVCTEWDLPYFSCRGYTSQSELWGAARRHIAYGVPVTVLHLGDHDPSGLDMTRDIQERLMLFEADSTVDRVALNMVQVRQHQPPPNPAKSTDSRIAEYRRHFGEESWELDALSPATIEELIRERVVGLLDLELFEARRGQQEAERELLERYAATLNAGDDENPPNP